MLLASVRGFTPVIDESRVRLPAAIFLYYVIWNTCSENNSGAARSTGMTAVAFGFQADGNDSSLDNRRYDSDEHITVVANSNRDNRCRD